MTTARLLRAGEVAQLLALDSARSFLMRRRRLEAERGFPAPVDSLLPRWDRTAIERWLDGRAITGTAGHMQAEDELIRRARGMGA